MSCGERWAHEALERMVLDGLSPAERTRLRTHAAGCNDCRVEYDRRARVEALGMDRASLPAMDALGAELLARVERSAPAHVRRQDAAKRPGWRDLIGRWRVFLAPAGLGLAAALTIVVLNPGDGYQPRSAAVAGAGSGAWGVRAFCVSEGPGAPRVLAEAGPGEALRCAPGHRLQFTATTPAPARLQLEGLRADAEPLRFLAPDEPGASLGEGVDRALPFSTPVGAEWLAAPVEVRARFLDANSGEVLGESSLRLLPSASAD